MAGGMRARYDPAKDKIIDDKSEDHWEEGYRLNPKSIYEIDSRDFNAQDFREKTEGKVVKCIAPGILAHVKHGDKIVYMTRDYDEIRESHDYARLGSLRYDKDEYEAMMDDTWRKLSKLNAVKFNYPEVVQAPVKHFKILKMLGWPIHVGRAAAEVNPDYYRFRNTGTEVRYAS